MITSKSTAAAAAIAAIAAAAIPPLTDAQAPHRPQTSRAKTETLRVFDKPVAITLTTRSGRVINHPPYPQAQAGDILDVYSLDYAGNHRRHARHWTMSGHLRCAFGHGQPVCEDHIAIGGSLLIFKGNKLVGGTGRYNGATGRVISNKEVPGVPDASDVVARIHRR